ncbi:hypothetical protein GGF31_000040 [Allomyces arbusculus]|nr:hypothetical protein GGF31_000040 [Allomyces arbusculus]
MMRTGSSPHGAATTARTPSNRRDAPATTTKVNFSPANSEHGLGSGDDDHDFDDDLPPLEDMSHELRRLREPFEVRRAAAPTTTATASKQRDVPISRDSTSLTVDLTPSNPFILGNRTAGPEPTARERATATGTSKAASPTTTKPTTASLAPSLGMKRGFLNAAPKKKAAPKSGEDVTRKPAPIPVLAPKTNATKDDPFVFKEVQDALNTSQGLLDKKGALLFTFTTPCIDTDRSLPEWLTPDLLTGIDQDRTLASVFDDAEFGQFLTAMQRNPAATLDAYRSHPRAQQFMAAMQKVTGMMGTQLDQLANRTPADTAPAATDLTEGLPEHERKIVDAVRKDPRLQDALRDPGVQQLMHDLRTRPGEVPRALQTQLSKDMLAKVQLLVEAGVLQLQS